jgi:hypothetical protein
MSVTTAIGDISSSYRTHTISDVVKFVTCDEVKTAEMPVKGGPANETSVIVI